MARSFLEGHILVLRTEIQLKIWIWNSLGKKINPSCIFYNDIFLHYFVQHEEKVKSVSFLTLVQGWGWRDFIYKLHGWFLCSSTGTCAEFLEYLMHEILYSSAEQQQGNEILLWATEAVQPVEMAQTAQNAEQEVGVDQMNECCFLLLILGTKAIKSTVNTVHCHEYLNNHKALEELVGNINKTFRFNFFPLTVFVLLVG